MMTVKSTLSTGSIYLILSGCYVVPINSHPPRAYDRTGSELEVIAPPVLS